MDSSSKNPSNSSSLSSRTYQRNTKRRLFDTQPPLSKTETMPTRKPTPTVHPTPPLNVRLTSLPQSTPTLSKPTTMDASSAQTKVNHFAPKKEKIKKGSTTWRNMIKEMGDGRRKVFTEEGRLRALKEKTAKQQVERPSVLQEEILFPNAEQWKKVVAEALSIAAEQQKIKFHASRRENVDQSLKLALKETWKKKKELEEKRERLITQQKKEAARRKRDRKQRRERQKRVGEKSHKENGPKRTIVARTTTICDCDYNSKTCGCMFFT